ncbi:MAG TPA: hypothetical protein VFC57_01085, partial [Aeromicrobium sp.]|nr:hypothetical protein [Aeromicrobium sp.]
MTPKIKRLTMNYGVEQDADGRDSNVIIVRLVGPGVDHSASYPVNEANEEVIENSVGRLKYIERQEWGPG